MESSRSRKRTRQAHDCAAAPPPEREVVARGGASPPWREDDRDGHFVFDLGENLTRRYKILSKMGEGLGFLQSVVSSSAGYLRYYSNEEGYELDFRSIRKYRDAAMIEIDVLNRLAENEKYRSLCVQIQRWFDYRNHICIVFEKLGPSLYDFLKRNRYQPFPVELVREFGRQLLESVAYMHELRLIHTDLKPENILLVSSEYIKVPSTKKNSQGEMHFKCLPKSSAIKLIDFGSTAFDNRNHNSIVSTRHYRAPEIILGLGWSFPCDIWSVGCILVELCSVRSLHTLYFSSTSLVIVFLTSHFLGGSIVSDTRESGTPSNDGEGFGTSTRGYDTESKDLVSRNADHSKVALVDLLYGLLRFEPSERLTAEEALDHPFFRNPT
ncbi:Serine/threonine-protein kinase AFC3 [Zea mays]|uniref:Serine/threonine-protein kinase AFC3 n=1 Tax=Zea mays TaxID=4577 RepID=A0A1D6FYD7_MAIZE|nr:Serine/threonine-protein kinase AFC3 [Zea mays]